MTLDAVLKVGGSLGRVDGLAELCREISRLAGRFSLLIVPGGGRFADLVREAYRRYRLDETTAHRMALLAMNRYGCLIRGLIAGSTAEVELKEAVESAGRGRAAVFLPFSEVSRSDPLPHSWDVTSDTIAAWIAHRAGCRRLVLLKDVDGLFASGSSMDAAGTLLAELTVEELAGHDGGVDRWLARFLQSARLDVWVINGRRPERLSEAVNGVPRRGTHILPAAGCTFTAGC
jgi:aspartokinase-like uncharacterized kinase